MKGLDMYGFKKRTIYRRQDHEDQIHEEQRHFDLKTFYQSSQIMVSHSLIHSCLKQHQVNANLADADT